MTPDEALQHPWILEEFQIPSSFAGSSSDESTIWEHTEDATSDAASSASSDAAWSTSGAGP